VIERARRKALVREYRERKQQIGVYAVRCEAVDKVWVAPTRNLDKQKNALWFTLRGGSHPNRSLQSTWNAQGEAAFQYEILEEVSDENPLVVDLLLKEKAQLWRDTLDAGRVVG